MTVIKVDQQKLIEKVDKNENTVHHLIIQLQCLNDS